MYVRVALKSLKKANLSTSLIRLHPESQALLLARRNFHFNRPFRQATYSPADLPDSVVTPDVIIREVDDGSNERVLKVTWSNGRLSRFPYVFLRENCKCNECFHPSSKQRLIDTVRDVDLNLKLIKQATVSVDGATLRCEWPDGHRSVYSANWLYERLMPEEDERRAKLEDAGGLVRDELILWGNERMQDNIPRYEYEAVMNDDKTLFDYLFTLYQYGLIVVENAPARSGVSAKLAARIGYHKSTHYGDGSEVKNKKDANNLAFTTGHLPFHVDLPFINSPPDIQSLHCIELNDVEGGMSLFVDGFNVAKQLKEKDPKAFKVLCQNDVPFVDKGTDTFGEFFMGHSRRTIQLNQSGRLQSIMYNNHVRDDSFRNATAEETVKFYDAYYQFNQMMYRPENVVHHQLTPGEIIQFHNLRVLHGRTAFTLESEKASRWLHGIYFEWDVVFSKLRVLHGKLGLKTPHLHEQSDDFF